MSSRYIDFLDHCVLGTPDGLCQDHNQDVPAHGAPGLLAWQVPALAPAELEDVRFSKVLEPLLVLGLQSYLLLLVEMHVHHVYRS